MKRFLFTFLFIACGFSKITIAVFPFYSARLEPSLSWIAVAIPEAISINLKKYHLQICPKETIYQAYQQLIDRASSPENSALISIAAKEEADFIIWGVILSTGTDSIKIYLKVIDVLLKKEVFSPVYSFRKVTNIVDINNTITKNIVEFLNLQTEQIETDLTTREIPLRLDSYELLTKGFTYHVGLFKNQSFDSALYYYQKSYLIDSTNFYLLYNMGNLFFAKHDFQNALCYYQKAINLGFTDADLFNNTGSVYLNLNQLDSAKYYLMRADFIEKNSPPIITNFGIYFYKIRNYTAAMYKLKDALGIAPNYYPAKYYLACCYIELAKYGDAKELLLSLINKKVSGISEFEIYQKLGLINQYLGNLEEAEIYYKKAINEEKNLNLYLSLADLYIIKEEYPNAIKILKEALIIAPSEPKLYYSLGEINEILNNKQEAINSYVNFLLFSKDIMANSEVANRVGKLYYSLGLKEKAEEFFIKAVEGSPLNVLFLRDLGLFYFKINNFQKAKEYYERVLQCGYSEVDAFKFLGLIYSNERNHSKAIIYFKEGAERAPQIADFWYYIGEQYANLGEIDSAKKYLQLALDKEFEEKNLEYALYYNLGIIYQYNQQGERFGEGFDIEKSIYYLKKASVYEPYYQQVKENFQYLEKITGRKIEFIEP